jgi:hypothetical protein
MASLLSVSGGISFRFSVRGHVIFHRELSLVFAFLSRYIFPLTVFVIG